MVLPAVSLIEYSFFSLPCARQPVTLTLGPSAFLSCPLTGATSQRAAPTAAPTISIRTFIHYLQESNFPPKRCLRSFFVKAAHTLKLLNFLRANGSKRILL